MLHRTFPVSVSVFEAPVQHEYWRLEHWPGGMGFGTLPGLARKTASGTRKQKTLHGGVSRCVTLVTRTEPSPEPIFSSPVPRSQNITNMRSLHALCRTFAEVKWIRKLVLLFSNRAKLSEKRGAEDHEVLPPTKLWEDNRSTISWVKNPVAHEKVKHIDVPLKALREAHTEFHSIDVDYLKTNLQLADGMTKSLPPQTHYQIMTPLLNWRPTSTAQPRSAAAAAACFVP